MPGDSLAKVVWRFPFETGLKSCLGNLAAIMSLAQEPVTPPEEQGEDVPWGKRLPHGWQEAQAAKAGPVLMAKDLVCAGEKDWSLGCHSFAALGSLTISQGLGQQ